MCVMYVCVCVCVCVWGGVFVCARVCVHMCVRPAHTTHMHTHTHTHTPTHAHTHTHIHTHTTRAELANDETICWRHPRGETPYEAMTTMTMTTMMTVMRMTLVLLPRLRAHCRKGPRVRCRGTPDGQGGGLRRWRDTVMLAVVTAHGAAPRWWNHPSESRQRVHQTWLP
jgi:hypothetical protein